MTDWQGAVNPFNTLTCTCIVHYYIVNLSVGHRNFNALLAILYITCTLYAIIIYMYMYMYMYMYIVLVYQWCCNWTCKIDTINVQ